MSSLTNLIGNYMSDTEDEENANEKSEANLKNSFSKEIGSLMNEIDDKREPSLKSKKHNVETQSKQSLPTTDWTQCIDPQSGHPYYWNIVTKEVTWEKPKLYEEYLSKIENILEKVPNDCWTVGYSDDTQTPYYVNQFTRVVKWDKPKNFVEKYMLKKKEKSKKIEKPISLASQRLKEKNKTAKLEKTKAKKLPDHLVKGSDEEVKIELINSYAAASSDTDSSDSDKMKKNCISNKLNADKITKSKLNLVAAYASDDDDDVKEEVNDENFVKKIEKSSEPIIVIPLKKKILKQKKVIAKKTSETPTATSPIELDINRPTTFASIITGGKPENSFDSEIDKLKEELERELAESAADNSEQTEEELRLSKENHSFDEKTFQRKRRIEFGLKRLVNTPKSLDETDNACSNISKADNNQAVELLKKKNIYMNFQKSHVEFTQNSKINEENDNLKIENESSDTLKEEIYFLSDLLLEKVNFLTVGHSEISPVQVIKIQLETLLTAYQASALDSEYFFKWLRLTSDDIQKLEENAAPDGWICKWDRKTSQYCYENIENSKIQWEYPEDDQKDKLKANSSATKTTNDVNGEEEMEISTTPPPNLNEQIIVKQHLPSDGNWDADNAPPPPIISAPSPPTISVMGINDELASFYSDIANIEGNNESLAKPEVNKDTNDIPQEMQQELTTDSTKRPCEDDSAILKKKRKKAKVQGLASLKTSEVTSMVAKWHKAQKELNQ